MGTKYSVITETPGIGASQEQLSMLYTRYKYASNFCKSKDILEVACGAGQGLGYLAQIAKQVVGGDIDEKNLEYATHYYEGRNIELHKLDAHDLPFEAKSFDTILLFEALYYLRDPSRFLHECRRVLRNPGTLLICTVNKDWSDFNPSPFSKQYFSAQELANLLKAHRFDVELFGAFPAKTESAKSHIVSIIKRAAVSLHLIPKTMKGKQLLKRIFFGKLKPLPSEVTEGMANYEPLVPLPMDGRAHSGYKVLFAKARVLD